jgi:uncharacterized phage protein (TIGR02218 family)
VRSWPSNLVTEAQSHAPRLALGLLIQRADGIRIAATTADIAGTIDGIPLAGATVDGVEFDPADGTGVNVSAISRSVGTDVDNLEAEVLEGGVMTLPDVLDQRWHAAPWVVGLYCWAHPEYGFGPISCGIVGKVKPRVGKFAVELRDLRQLLQGNPTTVTQRGCLWTLGSNSERDGFCTLDLTPHTVVDMPVSAVASQREFTINLLAAEPDDRFGNGLLTWTTGLNTGRTVRVRSFTGGVFELEEDMVQGIAVDDEATIVSGCRGRFVEDCVAKFDNALNFGGQPHAPGPDKAMNPPGEDAA